MKSYSAAGLLENLQQQTEQHIQKAIGEWQNIPASILEKSSREGSWSATECIEHLNIYGRYYLPAIERKIEKARKKNSKPSESFRSGWLGNYFTQLMQPEESGGVKKKMKTPANARPSGNLDTGKVVAEFIDQQEKLLDLLSTANLVDLNKIRVPISIARFIRLKLGDVLMFVIAHNHRHVLQVEKAIRDAKVKSQALKASLLAGV